MSQFLVHVPPASIGAPAKVDGVQRESLMRKAFRDRIADRNAIVGAQPGRAFAVNRATGHTVEAMKWPT